MFASSVFYDFQHWPILLKLMLILFVVNCMVWYLHMNLKNNILHCASSLGHHIVTLGIREITVGL